jgi:hypothetical protein
MVSGVARFDRKRNQWKRFPQIEPKGQIYEDRSGRLWFSDFHQICVYDKAKDSTKTFRLLEIIGDCGYSSELRRSYQDKRGQMLFADIADSLVIRK